VFRFFFRDKRRREAEAGDETDVSLRVRSTLDCRPDAAPRGCLTRAHVGQKLTAPSDVGDAEPTSATPNAVDVDDVTSSRVALAETLWSPSVTFGLHNTHTHTHAHTLSLSLSLTHTHTHSLSFALSLSFSRENSNMCITENATTVMHNHTLSLSLFLSLFSLALMV